MRKEKKLLEQFTEEIKILDNNYYFQLRPYIVSALSDEENLATSKLFNMIEYRKKELVSLELDMKHNFTNIEQQWNKYQNRAFLDAFKKIIKQDKGSFSIEKMVGTNFFNMTFSEIFDKAKELFFIRANEELEEGFKQNLKLIWDLLEEEYKKRLESDTFNNMGLQGTLQDYYNILQSKDKIKVKEREKKQRKEITVAKFAEDIVHNLLFNGLSAEYFLSLNEGSTHTGKVQKKYKSKTGEIKMGNIQSDVIQLVSMEAEFSEVLNKSPLSDLELELREKILKLKEIYSTDDYFLIHYSAKDLYQYSSERRVTIRESSALDYRIQELSEVAEIINEKDIDNLIFGLVNIGKGAIGEAQEHRNNIRDSIAALCATWMFEDYEETFKQLTAEKSNNRIHCYFINGKYYLLSDILYLIIKQFEKKNKNLVQVNLSLYKHDIYGEVRKENKYQGIPRWEEVRKQTLKKNNIGIRMDTLLLEKVLMDL